LRLVLDKGFIFNDEVIMKHFKVRVQYLNGIDFLFECDAVTGWQAGALARVAGRLAGMGGSMDVKETIVQEV
jgi:hypothetical protein